MNRSESPSPGLRPPSPPKAGERDGEGEVHGESPFVFSHTFVKTMNLVRNPKRRSGGVLQDLADLQAAVNQRASVLECGDAPPLSAREWTLVFLRFMERAPVRIFAAGPRFALSPD